MKYLVPVARVNAAGGEALSYQALTGSCRRQGIGQKPVVAAGQYHFEPGEEMQHDTSPHTVEVGGKKYKAQTASAVLCHSRMLFSRSTRRFRKHLSSRATQHHHMRVIDHHPRCRVPKMEAFGERLGFRFVAHEIGDAAPEVALYVAALKQESRKVVALALRQLLRLLREHPREPFLAAVREANQYGLYDLDRLERMILRRVSRDYFLLPDTEPDSND